MNRTAIICILVAGLSSWCVGQTLPPLTPVNVQDFTIPYEVGESVSPIRDVELLVSKDRGRRWHAAARQSAETGKFTFHADADGEYWFTFRTITTTGSVSPMNGLPQLRVLVDAKTPMVMLPSQSSESGPLTPPKPMRFRDEQSIKPQQSVQPGETSIPTTTEKPAMSMLGPKLPGLELPKEPPNHDADLLDNLLSGMSPFLDVQPVEVKSIVRPQVAADKSGTTAFKPPTVNAPAGSISGIFLNPTAMRPQVVVRWNTGHEPWHDAQIDIFRSNTKEVQAGVQPSPIAINLPNNGEYWWYLTPEDLKPFHVVVRIRSLYGGIHTDVTQKVITIDPQSLTAH